MDFGTLALVVAAGLFGPLLASAHRFGPPVVIGQIAAGVVIGTSGLEWVDPTDPVLTGLAAIGFALLMFVVGTHLPIRDVRLRSALWPGLGAAATVGALAVAAGLLLSPVVGLHRPAILAVLLATSSGAVALPVLQELDRSDWAMLVTTVWIAVADVVTVLPLPLVLAVTGLGRVVAGGALVIAAGALLYVAAGLARGHASVRPGEARCRTSAGGASTFVCRCWRCSPAPGWPTGSVRRSCSPGSPSASWSRCWASRGGSPIS